VSARIPESAIERSRPAGIPPDGGGEAALAFAIRAAGLPEPVTQHRFDQGCCGHSMKYHPLLKPRQCNQCAALGLDHPALARKARMWRFDFAWPAHMLAVEVDGGTWAGGRHTRGAGFERDCEKVNEAVLRGWRVLRFTTKQVDSGEALAWIERALGVTE
jgi:hypothetical protein